MKTKKQFINQHGDLGKELLKQYEFKNAVEIMEHHYYGEFYDREEFAKSFIRNRAEEMLPENSFEQHILSNWCDLEHVAWELFINDFSNVKVGNKIHVFSNI